MKTPSFNVQTHEVISHDKWVEARKALLAKEKEFTRLRDQLSQERRDLPWERVDKNYVFDGPAGKQSLADLWDVGCKSCSFWADNFNGIPAHLKARDVGFAAISRAPIAKIDAYRKRMGWDFAWVSSFENDLNRDFNVTFTEEELAKDQAYYNYTSRARRTQRARVSAPSTRMTPEKSTTRIRHSRAASILSMARTTIWISSPRVATKVSAYNVGSAGTMNTIREFGFQPTRSHQGGVVRMRCDRGRGRQPDELSHCFILEFFPLGGADQPITQTLRPTQTRPQ